MMFLNPDEIAICIDWLDRISSPPVQYLTRRDLLHHDPQSVEMQTLWRAVQAGPEAEVLFSRQNEDGSWFCGGPWGPRGYRRETGRGFTALRPKFVTTAWLLPFLGEMGFTAADVRIRKACEFILQEMDRPAPANSFKNQAVNCCGLYAIPLRALASVGMAADERLAGRWQWLERCQRDDGGWLNPSHLADSITPSSTIGRWPWDRSCAWGSYYAVQALHYAGKTVPKETLEVGLGFLLWHLSQSQAEKIQVWVYHGHNTLKELLMFSQAGIDPAAPPIQTLLKWLKSLYRPDEGLFRAQEKPITQFQRQVSAQFADYVERYGSDYWEKISKTSLPVLRYHLYHLLEDDWLTYTATRIAQNLLKNG